MDVFLLVFLCGCASRSKSFIINVAEGVGFEPTDPCGSPVFKTGAINRSTIPPILYWIWLSAGLAWQRSATFSVLPDVATFGSECEPEHMGTRQTGLPVLYRWAESQREQATTLFQRRKVRDGEAQGELHASV
jgi:hypothetical protein